MDGRTTVRTGPSVCVDKWSRTVGTRSNGNLRPGSPEFPSRGQVVNGDFSDVDWTPVSGLRVYPVQVNVVRHQCTTSVLGSYTSQGSCLTRPWEVVEMVFTVFRHGNSGLDISRREFRPSVVGSGASGNCRDV